MDEEELIRRIFELGDQGPLRKKVLPDGREVTVIQRMFNTILTIGPEGAAMYDQHW